MYLIWVIFNPFLSFIIIMTLTLRMMMWWLSNFFWIHLTENFIWCIKLILFFYDITLINVCGFESWWLDVMFTKWWTMTFFTLRSDSFDILCLFILFLLFFFIKYFPKITTIIRKSFSITKFHFKILLHLFFCYRNQTLSFDLIFVKYLFILCQINLLQELPYLFVIPLLYRLFNKRELDYLTYSIVFGQKRNLQFFDLRILFLEILQILTIKSFFIQN